MAFLRVGLEWSTCTVRLGPFVRGFDFCISSSRAWMQYLVSYNHTVARLEKVCTVAFVRAGTLRHNGTALRRTKHSVRTTGVPECCASAPSGNLSGVV
jgi:hypothetical protein